MGSTADVFVKGGWRIDFPAEMLAVAVSLALLLSVVAPGATPALVVSAMRRKRRARAVVGSVLAVLAAMGSAAHAPWPWVAGFVGLAVCSVGAARAVTRDPTRARRWVSATTAMGLVLLLATVGTCVFRPALYDAAEATP